ncbi:MAG: alpha-hydroxy acid oxidase [Saprospiraceae bacterium]
MKHDFNPLYPSIDHLRLRAQQKIPKFAFDYLDNGCNQNINLHRNTSEIRDIELIPNYISTYKGLSLKTNILGVEYDYPFGIAPIGLQGLMWPKASEILAKTAFEHNIPYILSTVGTADIETIGNITEGKAWFQLYHPTKDEITFDLLQRCKDVGIKVLVILADVPSFGYRPKEIANGLSIPPRMTLKNILQILSSPHWALHTLYYGQPTFKTMLPYTPKKLNLKHLGIFMNQTFSGRLTKEKIDKIRNNWDGKLIVKGIASEADAEIVLRLGADGIIVSNHGGRQLDMGQTAIKALNPIVKNFQHKTTIMMDSGIRSGTDIANVLAHKAQFCFLGRSFMYGVSALGRNGGKQVMEILSRELKQVMEQIGCERIGDLPAFTAKEIL